MKQNRTMWMLLANLIIITAFSGVVSAEKPWVDSCTIISEPGTYFLKEDIEESVFSKCIEITSSDVILDGKGHKIDAAYAVDNYGVYVNDVNPLTNVIIKDLELTDWGNGIYFKNSHDGQIIDNKVSLNVHGINLISSNNNQVSNNIAELNKVSGIRLESSAQNILMDNIASSNMVGFSFFYSSNNNILKYNKIDLNELFGIALGQSKKNELTSNILTNNKNGIYIYSSTENQIYDNYFNNSINHNFNEPANSNYWNTTLTSGTNIVGGQYIGGNFWGYPDGTGHSQECTDSNIEGICDLPYTIDPYKIDNLPLSSSGGPIYPLPEVSTIILVFGGIVVLIGITRYKQ